MISNSELIEKGDHYEIYHIYSPISYEIVLRKCPFCDRMLIQSDFFGDDRHWNNLKLSIPCCQCHDIMIYIQKGIEYGVRLYGGYRWIIEFTTDMYDIKMPLFSFVLYKQTLEKFISLGFIDPEFVEMKK